MEIKTLETLWEKYRKGNLISLGDLSAQED